MALSNSFFWFAFNFFTAFLNVGVCKTVVTLVKVIALQLACLAFSVSNNGLFDKFIGQVWVILHYFSNFLSNVQFAWVPFYYVLWPLWLLFLLGFGLVVCDWSRCSYPLGCIVLIVVMCYKWGELHRLVSVIISYMTAGTIKGYNFLVQHPYVLVYDTHINASHHYSLKDVPHGRCVTV